MTFLGGCLVGIWRGATKADPAGAFVAIAISNLLAGTIAFTISGVLVLVGVYAARDVRLLENVALAGVMILFSVAVFVWLLGLPLPLWPNS